MEMSSRRYGVLLGFLTFCVPVKAIDLRGAAVVTSAHPTGPEQKASVVLVEEVEKRTGIRLPVAARMPASGPAILIGEESGLRGVDATLVGRLTPATAGADGYRLQVVDGSVLVCGNDPRGTLFGVGALLRQLRMDRDRIELPDTLKIATAPKYSLRGHQLGYRPKTNSYDGWTVPVWDQYIRDLAVFGTNAIELIPPRSDDAADSPHFPLPPMRMMMEMSRIADEYGLDVWIWYPAMDRDYSDPKTVEAALAGMGRSVFQQLPRVDAVFVPGGDPGHTAAEISDGACSRKKRRCCTAIIPRRRCGSRRRVSTANGWMSF